MVKITACPSCGSTDISMGSLGDGVLFGIGSWKLVCKNCGYQGAPLNFDSIEEYKQYCTELHADENKSTPERKQIIPDKILTQTDKDQLEKIEEDEQKGRWRVFVVSVIFSILLTILFMPYYFSVFQPVFAFIALIGAFIGFLFFTVLILLFLRFIIKEKIP